MNTLARRFPTPSLAPSRLSPPRFPGISPRSTEKLKEVLQDNHKRWHIFFNDARFIKYVLLIHPLSGPADAFGSSHASHRAIALWAIGANGDVIMDGYKKDLLYEKPAIQSPASITEDNFGEHLGNDK